MNPYPAAYSEEDKSAAEAELKKYLEAGVYSKEEQAFLTEIWIEGLKKTFLYSKLFKDFVDNLRTLASHSIFYSSSTLKSIISSLSTRNFPHCARLIETGIFSKDIYRVLVLSKKIMINDIEDCQNLLAAFDCEDYLNGIVLHWFKADNKKYNLIRKDLRLLQDFKKALLKMGKETEVANIWFESLIQIYLDSYHKKYLQSHQKQILELINRECDSVSINAYINQPKILAGLILVALERKDLTKEAIDNLMSHNINLEEPISKRSMLLLKSILSLYPDSDLKIRKKPAAFLIDYENKPILVSLEQSLLYWGDKKSGLVMSKKVLGAGAFGKVKTSDLAIDSLDPESDLKITSAKSVVKIWLEENEYTSFFVATETDFYNRIYSSEQGYSHSHFFKSGSKFYQTLPLIGAENLEDFLYEENLDNSEKLTLMTAMIAALIPLHQKGIVHSDIRIANMRKENGEVFLIDFNLTTTVGVQWDAIKDYGRYSPPEKYEGYVAELTFDIYALAIILFSLFHDSLPGSHLEFLKAKGIPIPAAELELFISENRDFQDNCRLDTILKKALSIEPKERYADAMAFLEDWRTLTVEDLPSLNVDTVKHNAP